MTTTTATTATADQLLSARNLAIAVGVLTTHISSWVKRGELKALGFTEPTYSGGPRVALYSLARGQRLAQLYHERKAARTFARGKK